MPAQPKYITQPEFDNALIAFSGHIDHAINMSRADFRRDLVETENRLSAKIDGVKADLEAKIDGVKTDLQTQIDTMNARLDRVENMGKVNHQMLQLVLDQLSKINKKLGVD